MSGKSDPANSDSGNAHSTAPVSAFPADRAVPLLRARLCIVSAALLWSTAGAFTKILREETPLGLDVPRLDPLQIAAGRVFCAAVVLMPFLSRRDVSFRPWMALPAMSFAVLNITYIMALSWGSAANAVLLQYTGPIWAYLISVGCLAEKVERRGAISLLIGVGGIGVIVFGGWRGEELVAVLLGLVSGVALAGVLVGLRLVRDASSRWVTALNLWCSSLVLLPFVWQQASPTLAQTAFLLLYGATQVALPCCLLAHGLHWVSPEEAGTLSLLEPLLTPLWAYLASPATENLTAYTLVGGACILSALCYRYWPFTQGRTAGSSTPGR